MISLQKPLSFAHYSQWLQNNNHADMGYMAKNQRAREQPSQHFAPMRSMIVFTRDYFPVPKNEDNHFPGLKVAHYARNTDYHLWFREQLNEAIERLEKQFPEAHFLSFTDAVPLLERDHAVQAGLGWIGKNTCLIHPKQGSLFFIGEILTSLECDVSHPPMHDFCGSCTACIEVCPTGALDEPRSLDANKCIAYWNIESKGVVPKEMRPALDDWFFGCDLCQTVCPWNMKLFKDETDFQQITASPEAMEKDLRHILTSSNKALLKEVNNSPLSRAGGRGLKRNALVVIGNLKLQNLRTEVSAYLEHEILGDLAEWTLSQLPS